MHYLETANHQLKLSHNRNIKADYQDKKHEKKQETQASYTNKKK